MVLHDYLFGRLFLPGKSLQLRSKYTKNVNVTNYIRKIEKSLPGEILKK